MSFPSIRASDGFQTALLRLSDLKRLLHPASEHKAQPYHLRLKAKENTEGLSLFKKNLNPTLKKFIHFSTARMVNSSDGSK